MIKNVEIMGAIAVGGAIGAVARHLLGMWSLRTFPADFPWGTLIANVSGSIIMGLLVVWLSATEEEHRVLRSFALIGLLGAFTTFSTFSLDAVVLFEKRGVLLAGLYAGGSFMASIGGLVLGLGVGRALS